MQRVTISGHPAVLLFGGVAAFAFAVAFVYMGVRLAPLLKQALPQLQKAGGVAEDIQQSALARVLLAR